MERRKVRVCVPVKSWMNLEYRFGFDKYNDKRMED